MTASAPTKRWLVPLGTSPPDDLPEWWAFAVAAVSHDLGLRRHGRTIDLDHVVWNLASDADGSMYIGVVMASVGDLEPQWPGRTAGFLVETIAAQAAVWMAETVQDELAGYEFVQWPIHGQRLLLPRIVDGAAVWVDPSSGISVAPVGGLADEPTP
jgi:hypothetical protein